MSLKVTIIENGPLIIHPPIGEYIELTAPHLTFIGGVRESVAICRCGKTADPTGVWCDGSHKFKIVEENDNN